MWLLKIIVKIFLARLPVGYSLWRLFSLYRHGMMDDPSYLFETTDKHLRRLFFSKKIEGRSILELGPGDSIGSAFIINARGGRSTLVDEVPAATLNMSTYENIATGLVNLGEVTSKQINSGDDFSSLLHKLDCCYMTDGLESLRAIQAETFDGIFSQAVLEHIHRNIYSDVMKELFRISKVGSLSSHRVDLKDHLTGSLNNLRFSTATWESNLFKRSGFYTNRLRLSEHLNAFKLAGFQVVHTDIDRWKSMPLRKNNIHAEFSRFSEDELLVSGFNVLLKKL